MDRPPRRHPSLTLPSGLITRHLGLLIRTIRLDNQDKNDPSGTKPKEGKDNDNDKDKDSEFADLFTAAFEVELKDAESETFGPDYETNVVKTALLQRRLQQIHSLQGRLYEWDRCLGFRERHPLQPQCFSCIGFRITKEVAQSAEDLRLLRKLYDLEDCYLRDEGLHLRISDTEISAMDGVGEARKEQVGGSEEQQQKQKQQRKEAKTNAKTLPRTKEELLEAREKRLQEINKFKEQLAESVKNDAQTALQAVYNNAVEMAKPETYVRCAQLVYTSVSRDSKLIIDYLASLVTKGGKS